MVRRQALDAASTFVPTTAAEVGAHLRSSNRMATFLRSWAEAQKLRPSGETQGWVVEVCHSGFNRFRKLLVRYEKLESGFVACNHPLPRSSRFARSN